MIPSIASTVLYPFARIHGLFCSLQLLESEFHITGLDLLHPVLCLSPFT